MEVLFRAYDGKNYVWKEATYSNNVYIVDRERYLETTFLAVKGSDMNDYVICKYCRARVKNNPESIERHYAEREAQKNCLQCRNLRVARLPNETPTRAFAKSDADTYHVVETFKAQLQCGRNWISIDNPNATQTCEFYQCRHAGMETQGGILVQYPDLFETQITVDVLQAKGYEFLYGTDSYFVYNMKMRDTMHAYVDKCGVVDHFSASYRYNVKDFYYSATHDKLFFVSNGTYREGKPHDWSDSKYEAVKKKIVTLYKEAAK